jgi:hypothetical protein
MEKVETIVGRHDIVSGFNSPPLPFKAAFIPRDKKVPEILRKELAATQRSTSDILEEIEHVNRFPRKVSSQTWGTCEMRRI